MLRVRRASVLDAPVDAVWRLLRDFNGHERWHPLVARSVLETGRRGDQVGAVRDFTLTTGERVREILLSLSDRERRLRYAVVESDLPLQDYVAELFLKPVTDGDRTFWSWSSRFRAPAGQERTLARLVAEQVYEAGFDGVRAALGGGRRRSRATAPATGGALPERVPAPASRPPPDPDPAAGDRGGAGGAAGAVAGEATIIERHGGAEVFRSVPVAAPPPGPGEVRLRHTAIGLNYIDVYCRTGYFDLVQPPAVLGMEAAGTVIDTGPGVPHLVAGQRVAYACPPPGAYATVRTLDAACVVPLPDRIDEESAAAGLLKGMSAEFLLHRVHVLRAGEIVLVFAPAGGVGHLLCQWAARLGARVIGATRSEAKARAARAAGVPEVILPGEGSLEEQVMDLTGGHGADVIYDGVGRDSFPHSVAALAVGGHLVSFGQASGDIGPCDLGALAAKSVTLSRPNFVHFTDTPEKVAAITGRLFAAMEGGLVHVEIGRRYPLRDAAAAHRALEAGETLGATILVPEAQGAGLGQGEARPAAASIHGRPAPETNPGRPGPAGAG